MMRNRLHGVTWLGMFFLCLLVVSGCARQRPNVAHVPAPSLAAADSTPAPFTPAPAPDVPRATDVMRVAGLDVAIGTRVVLFDEPGGYSAYRGPAYFNDRNEDAPVSSPAELAALIDRVVLHYDAAGSSARCFEILQENRGLSCHFLLDVDGIIYQTLDLKERAWHAGTSNSRSVGIEIANIGAYPPSASDPLTRWYQRYPDGSTRLVLPPGSGVRRPEQAKSPARPAPVVGLIHGRRLVQHDLTDAQYAALIKLVAALCQTFPRVSPDAPRIGGDPDAGVLPGLMTATDRHGFGGIVGHHHLTGEKVDPGPAFDWPRLLEGLHDQPAADGG